MHLNEGGIFGIYYNWNTCLVVDCGSVLIAVVSSALHSQTQFIQCQLGIISSLPVAKVHYLNFTKPAVVFPQM